MAGDRRPLHSLLGRVICVIALALSVPNLSSDRSVAYAHGIDDVDDELDEPDAPDIDEPDAIDEPAIDEPDIPDIDDPDAPDEPDLDEPDESGDQIGAGDDPSDISDNSGPGSHHDTLDDPSSDGDNSGPGSDNSGRGGDDDGDDNSGSESGHSGHGDDSNNSGPGSSNPGSGSADDESGALAAGAAIYHVEHDEYGHEYVSGEVILVGNDKDVLAARSAGFNEVTRQDLASGGVMARMTIPANFSLQQAVASLAERAPDALVTANNIYRSAQAAQIRTARAFIPRRAPHHGAIGIIDTGVDAASLPNHDALLSHRAFAAREPVARDHGSMVAAIAIDHGAHVHVADVFGRSTDGALAASAERIAMALDWMVARGIAVINISIEGPENAVLQELVRRAAQRGHVIVAAAGNGGPMARPAFPAAFDGVLAVTAIDGGGRPYLRASRGAYIDFAAPGVNVAVASGDRTIEVSGTSFAAPVVAAQIAAHLHAPSPTQSARAVSALRERAEDLGAPGRDPVFGWGALYD